MKALVGAFNQEKALVGAFSVIVQLVVEPMEHYTALLRAEAMADFDAIYEDQQDEVSSILEGPDINLVPDPVIIRGAGNITV